MPFSPDEDLMDKLCEACGGLARGGRGHTFLMPFQQAGSPGQFCCAECGAIWHCEVTPEGRRWTVLEIRKREQGD
jgi:hypothetical protein